MEDNPLDFILVGVEHTDDRNEEEITQRLKNNVGHVYHENSLDRTLRNTIIWMLVAPGQALNNIGNNLGGSVSETACWRAAQALAEQEGVEPVTPIGMNIEERIRQKPSTETLFSLIIVLWGVCELWYFNANPGLLDIFRLMAVPLLLLLIGRHFSEQEYDRRERVMCEKVHETEPVNPSKPGVLIIGEDHIAGVGGKLQNDGYQVQSIWLNSILKERDFT